MMDPQTRNWFPYLPQPLTYLGGLGSAGSRGDVEVFSSGGLLDHSAGPAGGARSCAPGSGATRW